MSAYEKPALNIIVGPWAKWAKSCVLLLDEVSRDEIETMLREMGMTEDDVQKFTRPVTAPAEVTAAPEQAAV